MLTIFHWMRIISFVRRSTLLPSSRPLREVGFTADSGSLSSLHKQYFNNSQLRYFSKHLTKPKNMTSKSSLTINCENAFELHWSLQLQQVITASGAWSSTRRCTWTTCTAKCGASWLGRCSCWGAPKTWRNTDNAIVRWPFFESRVRSPGRNPEVSPHLHKSQGRRFFSQATMQAASNHVKECVD